MYTPKFSVILPNYLIPVDRFTHYGGTPKPATELIDICGKQGVFQGVELLLDGGPAGITEQNKLDVRAALEANGLNLAGVLAITYSAEFAKGSFANPDPRVRRLTVDTVKRAMDIAAELGCEYVGQWPGQDGWDYYFESDYQKMYDWWVDGMQQLADYNPNIKLGLEPKPYEPRQFSFIDKTSKVLLLLRDINRKNVGLTLDIGHSMYGQENLAEAVTLAQRDNRLFHLHMNDNYGTMDGDLPFGSVHLLGYLEFFYWLRRTGYEGYHSVDIFAYRTDPAETVLEGQMWMQALYDLVERAGIDKLEDLVKQSDGVAAMRFFRELMFGRVPAGV
jgi:sugar phosphate isomerase/epimerase